MIDLDGVLTDFDKQLAKLLDRPLDRDWDFGNDPKVWAKISKAGEEFWSTMKFMPDGEKLWNAIKKYDPTILSSPTRHPSSIEGKKKWLKKHLPGVPYIIESKKEKYAEPGAILIDDREKNIKKWEDAGGIGILHKDAESTIRKLNKILGKEKEATIKTVEDPSGRKIVLDKPRVQETFSPAQLRQKIIRPKTLYDRSKNRVTIRDIGRDVMAGRVVLFYLSGPT
jgi:5'(3')-deoxyribonucleotidase